jgi:hypothetical protein
MLRNVVALIYFQVNTNVTINGKQMLIRLGTATKIKQFAFELAAMFFYSGINSLSIKIIWVKKNCKPTWFKLFLPVFLLKPCN